MGWVYTWHFERPIKTRAPEPHWPRHVTGWTAGTVEGREADHIAGKGSKLFTLAREQGIGWDLADAERGDRNRERQLKQRAAGKRCIICHAERLLTEGE
jgi:hypothetical protein